MASAVAVYEVLAPTGQRMNTAFDWIAHKKYRLLLRLRGAVIRHYIIWCGGTCGKGLLVDAGFFMKHAPHQGICIGEDVAFGRNTTLDVPRGGSVTIRRNVSLTMNVLVAAAESVTVDEQTMIAEFTSIRDADHGISVGTPIRNQPLSTKPVVIGKNVWIGRGVAVLKGSSIGDGAVIGANAVVNGIIPADGIAVGAPARVVKFRHDL